jgi:hypothetical protein
VCISGQNEGLNVKRFAFAGAVAALTMVVAGSASAATTFFVPDGSSPQPGFTVIDNFNTALGLTGTAGLDYVLTTSHTPQGAPPANSVPYDTQYLDVLSGGTTLINFSALTSVPVVAFEFDWGSIDSFNTLTVHSNQGDLVLVPGSSSFPNAADGNQVAPGTNGLFRVDGAPGQIFSGITLQSSGYSFEVDNLAIGPVPEPASWAMMIMGMGFMGMALRSRRKVFATFA